MKQPFDFRRAAFWLIAAVLGVQMIVVLSIVFSCIFAGFGGTDTTSCRDTGIGELLASALATALALMGASTKKDGE